MAMGDALTRNTNASKFMRNFGKEIAVAYRDLREFITQIEEIGELRRVSGVDWNLEMGAISQMCHHPVLIDDVPGYPEAIASLLAWLVPLRPG